MTVVTLVDEPLRRVVEAAAIDDFRCEHTSSIAQALTAVRGCSARAVLLSPAIAAEVSNAALRRLVLECLGVSVIVVLGEDWAVAHSALLRLGACGILRVANLVEREGWNRLRAFLLESCDDTTARVIAHIQRCSSAASAEARQLLVRFGQAAATSSSTTQFAQSVGVNASSLTSRFFRAKLPSPKSYLVASRLLYAAAYLETGEVSIVAVANRLGFSSPQSFGRHVRIFMGISAGEFRRQFSFDAAAQYYADQLVRPHVGALASFQPKLPPFAPVLRSYGPRDKVPLMAAEP